MDTLEINRLAELNPITSALYLGCFGADELPREKLTRRGGLVVNLCEASNTSEFCHWASIWIENDFIIYFDSGMGNSYKYNSHIENFVRLQEKNIYSNKNQIQSFNSNRCGIFVLCFIFAMSLDVSLNIFLNKFKRVNLEENDEIVDGIFRCAYIDQKKYLCLKSRKKLKVCTLKRKCKK